MTTRPSTPPNLRHAHTGNEVWDSDFDFPESPPRPKASARPSTTTAAPRPFPRGIDANAEAGPSTPSSIPLKRASMTQGPSPENWDADFLDRDSPAGAFPSPPRAPASAARRRARSAAQNSSTPTPPVNARVRRIGSYAPPSPTRALAPERENWDADFEFGLRPATTPAAAAATSTAPTHVRAAKSSWSSSDEERELGLLAPDEEDRTVTARHKRVPIPIRLDTPPPVPPLPAGLPPRSPITMRAQSSLSTHSEAIMLGDPSSRSPAASMFSLPTLNSGRESSLGSHTVGTFSSTTGLGLRQTISGTSSSRQHLAHAFALPPTPPQPRERRRLRKKRDREDVVELRDMDERERAAVLRKRRPLPRAEDVFDPSRRQSIEELPEPDLDAFDDDIFEDEEPADEPPPRPRTPERPVVPLSPPVQTPAPVATSPSGRTPLLARIGSVTRWGARKKRSSTVPLDTSPGGSSNEVTPRPPSSLAQGGGAAGSPPVHKTGWFRSPPPAAVDLQRKDSSSRLRHQLHPAQTPGSPSRRKGTSMPPLLSFMMQRQASSGTDDLPLDDLVLPGHSHLQHAIPPVPPLPDKSQSRISRRLSALPLPGRAQKPRNLSFGGSSNGGASRSSLSVHQVGLPTGPSGSAEPTPRRPSRSRSRVPNGIISPSQDSFGAGQSEEGSNRLMARVRRLSFAKKHRSSRSLAGNASNSIPLPDPAPVRTMSQEHERPSSSSKLDLLPPIELQPPSPPMTLGRAVNAAADGVGAPSLRQSLELLRSAGPVGDVVTSPRTPPSGASPNATRPTSPGAYHASLGRATASPVRPRERDLDRRNSLGDLKIPARISQAQVGLKMNLSMVREFSMSIDRLRELQTEYASLMNDVQQLLQAPPSAPAVSQTPSFNPPRRPSSRARSNTNPHTGSSHAQLASAMHAIAAKYRITWECCELLIELGGGPTSDDKAQSPPTASVSVPMMSGTELVSPELRHKRERTMTLESRAGDSDGPPVDPAWRGSSGRSDLSKRQLMLLRDMLQGGDASAPSASPISPPMELDRPQSANRMWKWGDAMGSTVTLPSDEGGMDGMDIAQKRQSGVRLGMRGLRDILRILKKSKVNYAEELRSASVEPSPVSGGGQPHHQATQRPRSKTSSAAQSAAPSMRSTHFNMPPPDMIPVPSGTMASTLSHKPSPRRPSLASIFRLGQRHRSGGGPPSSSGNAAGAGAGYGTSSDAVGSVGGARTASGSSRPSSTSSEDWDRLDSASDVDATAAAGVAKVGGANTVRVPGSSQGSRSPYQRSSTDRASPTTFRAPMPAASRSSIFTDAASSAHSHGRKLSHVEEVAGAGASSAVPSRRASVRSNRAGHTGSVRLPPAHGTPAVQGSVRARVSPQALASPLPDPQLAMTPENLRPLLENAREVQSRLTDCVSEVRGLLAARSGAS